MEESKNPNFLLTQKTYYVWSFESFWSDIFTFVYITKLLDNMNHIIPEYISYYWLNNDSVLSNFDAS